MRLSTLVAPTERMPEARGPTTLKWYGPGADDARVSDRAQLVDRNGFWRGRPVLVTGAAGLLGSWLVPRLLAR
jgi:hypothetical protein